MRVIVRNIQLWGNYSTQGFEVEPNISIHEFKTKISNRLSIPINNMLVKFERDGYTIRLTEDFPLDFYQPPEKTIFYVERIDISFEEQTKARGKKINNNYLGKLGLLSSIKESMNDEDNNESHDKTKDFENSLIDGVNSFSNSSVGSSEDEGKSKKFFELKTYFKNELDLLLKATKHGYKIEEVEKIFTSLPAEEISNDIKEKILDRKKYFMNELYEGGWNAFHFAIFYSQNDLVKYYIQKGADVNIRTREDWTPLQLSVYKNNLQAMKMILDAPGVEINAVTAKGTALHIACKQDKQKYIVLLLKNKADPSIKDENDRLPQEMCSNEETKKLLNNNINEEKTLFFEDNSSFSPKLSPKTSFEENNKRPPIVLGWLYKISGLYFTVQERFIVVDPYEGSFIRFRRREHYPLNPIEIIPLQDIKSCKYREKSWYMPNDYHYFDVIATSSKQTFACKHDHAAKEWIDSIKSAKEYANQIDKQIKEKKNNLDLITNISSLEMKTQAKNHEIFDEKRKFAENFKNRPVSNPFPAFQDSDLSSPVSPNLSERNISVGPISNGSNNSKENNENEADVQIQISIHPQENEKNHESIPNNSKNINKKCNCPVEQAQKIVLPKSDVKHHVKFESFDLIRLIGKGSFGQVFLGRKKDDNTFYAIKALKKRTLIMKKQLRYAISEANVLKISDHPFVLGLHYAFQTKEYLYFVMDYCPGGDLSYHLAQRITFEEDVAKFYIAEVVLAIEHLHNLNIIYRDLKPENILICSDGHIKLADFGLAKEGVDDGQTANSFCGSPAYLAPEVIKHKGSGKPADIYGIGTVLYEMLTGNPPYYDEHIPTLYKNIQEGNLVFPNCISKDAENLIRRFLHKDPNSRIGVKNKKEIKEHPFFDGIDWDKILKKEYEPPFIEKDEEVLEEIPIPRKPLFRDFDYDENQIKINKLKNFSFAREKHQKNDINV